MSTTAIWREGLEPYLGKTVELALAIGPKTGELALLLSGGALGELAEAVLETLSGY